MMHGTTNIKLLAMFI